MSIQGKYKMNIDGEKEIYSLKNDGRVVGAVQVYQYTTPISSVSELVGGEKYRIFVPAHTKNVFNSTLTGIINCDVEKVTTSIQYHDRGSSGSSGNIFGYSNGTFKCYGFVHSTDSGFHQLCYQLDDADYDFEAIIVYNSYQNTVSKLIPFIYKRDSSPTVVWAAPFRTTVRLSPYIMTKSGVQYYSPGNMTTIQGDDLLSRTFFALKKIGGINPSDQIGDTSTFSSFHDYQLSGALTSYKDRYELVAVQGHVGNFISSVSPVDSRIYPSEVEISTDTVISPTTIPINASEITTHIVTQPIQIYFKGFNIEGTRISASKVTFRNTGSRDLYVSLTIDPHQRSTTKIPAGGSAEISTYSTVFYIYRAPTYSSDYQTIVIPQ